MDYASFVLSLRQLLLVASIEGTNNLMAILPDAINYAELRIYREFNFLATQTSDHANQTTAGVRRVAIPDGMIVVEGISLILPAGKIPTDTGAQRVPLLRTSRGFLDTTWPIETDTETPVPFETYYAIFSDEEDEGEGLPAIPNAAIIGPTPDGAYRAEFTGTFRPTPLSAANTETPLTRFWPDLFLAASMVWLAGWQRSFGAQSDDPRMAVSWEATYQALSRGTSVEEARKRGLHVPYGQVPPSQQRAPASTTQAPDAG